MEVIANGQKIPFNITEEKNWSDVLKTLLLLTNQANKLIFECKINGEIISLIERNKYTDHTVESIEKIEITVANKAERVIESLKEIEKVYPTFI